MNLLREKLRASGLHRACKGGSSNDQTSSNATTTTNNDLRAVLGENSQYLGAGASSMSSSWSNANTSTNVAYDDHSWSDDSTRIVSNDNSVTYSADAEVLKTFAQSMPDAVKFLARAGVDLIDNAGGAIVDMNRDSIKANSMAWDSTLETGASMVDNMINKISAAYTTAGANIGQSYGLAAKAIESFTPTENKNADIGKYAMLAAAAVCAVVLLRAQK